MKLFRPKWQTARQRRDEWRARHPEAGNIYMCVVALRETAIRDMESEALKKLVTIECPPGTDANLVNLSAEIKFKVVAIGAQLSATRTLLAVAEASEQFKLAEREFAPLLRQAEEAEAAEEKARRDRQRKEIALRDAREAAKQRALESFESDPAVVAAKRELAALQVGTGL